MRYLLPAIEGRQPIGEPFVLGIPYTTPTWTDRPDREHESKS